MKCKIFLWIFIVSIATTILNVYLFDIVVVQIIEEQHEETNTSQSKIKHYFHSKLLVQYLKQSEIASTKLDIHRTYMEKLNVLNEYLTQVFSPPDYIDYKITIVG